MNEDKVKKIAVFALILSLLAISTGTSIISNYYNNNSYFSCGNCTNGINGTNGLNGSNGLNGINGTDGSNGANGYTPIKGIDYFDGVNGTNGINQSDPTKANLSGAFFNGMIYVQNRSVVLSSQPPFISFSGTNLNNGSWINLTNAVNASSVSVNISSLPDTTNWYNLSFTNRSAVQINNTGNASTLSYYQINYNVTYKSGMQNNFDDIRFWNITSNQNQPYWIESKVNGSYANVWVNVTSIPASSWLNDTIYMYYGNPSAVSASDGVNTFVWYDDFSNDKTASYSKSGTWVVANGEVTHSAGDNGYLFYNVGTPPYIIKARAKSTTTDNWWGLVFRVQSTQGGDTSSGVVMQPITDTILNRLGGTQTSFSQTGQLNTYFDIIVIDSGTATQVFFNGVNKGSITSSISNTNTYAGFTGNGVNRGAADYWYVRKYVAIEPTVTTGAEEVPNTITIIVIQPTGHPATTVSTNVSNISFSLNLTADSLFQNMQFFSISTPFDVSGIVNIIPSVNDTQINYALSGVGNAYACINMNGNLYRSNITCV